MEYRDTWFVKHLDDESVVLTDRQEKSEITVDLGDLMKKVIQKKITVHRPQSGTVNFRGRKPWTAEGGKVVFLGEETAPPQESAVIKPKEAQPGDVVLGKGGYRVRLPDLKCHPIFARKTADGFLEVMAGKNAAEGKVWAKITSIEDPTSTSGVTQTPGAGPLRLVQMITEEELQSLIKELSIFSFRYDWEGDEWWFVTSTAVFRASRPPCVRPTPGEPIDEDARYVEGLLYDTKEGSLRIVLEDRKTRKYITAEITREALENPRTPVRLTIEEKSREQLAGFCEIEDECGTF